jgi:uncharacterized protein (UPF0548 family)
MFLLREPSAETIQRFISSQRDLPFSYRQVGATREEIPAGYTTDHNRIKLGAGSDTFDRAVAALRQWKQFDLGWVRMVPPGSPLEVGAVVAILTRHFGFWSLNACRIVYTIDEVDRGKRFGFAYGTLSSHVERGEERFTIEWDSREDSVWYDILAFSTPNQLVVRLTQPVARMLQKRFTRDSLAAMVASVKQS